MRIIKAVLLSVCVVMLCAVLSAPTNAGTWNKKTFVTFADSVEIPGQILPAGTYVFKLMDSAADRGIVQIWTGDETQLLATLITVRDSRWESPNKTIIEFDERPGDSPMAVRSWFYPGDKTGWDFIYPYEG
ncbi:MAG: hypothetical protein WBG02_20305 [Candidatus Acidiferrum sp.]